MGLLSGKKQSIIGDEKNVIQQIPIKMIVQDEHQPRKRITGIEQLAESIKTTNGIQTPLHVLQIGENQYQIITGERRYLAAQHLLTQGDEWRILGESVPCIVYQKQDLDETDILRLQLIENLQREDLTAIEEARAYQRLIDQGMTQQQIANQLGKSKALISGCLAILSNIPEDFLKLIEALDPPPSKRELIKIAQEKEEKREALVNALLGKPEGGQKEEVVTKEEEITGEQVWEWLKKLIKKDKDVLLKFISPAKIRKLKETVEGSVEEKTEADKL